MLTKLDSGYWRLCSIVADSRRKAAILAIVLQVVLLLVLVLVLGADWSIALSGIFLVALTLIALFVSVHRNAPIDRLEFERRKGSIATFQFLFSGTMGFCLLVSIPVLLYMVATGHDFASRPLSSCPFVQVPLLVSVATAMESALSLCISATLVRCERRWWPDDGQGGLEEI